MLISFAHIESPCVIILKEGVTHQHLMNGLVMIAGVDIVNVRELTVPFSRSNYARISYRIMWHKGFEDPDGLIDSHLYKCGTVLPKPASDLLLRLLSLNDSFPLKTPRISKN